MYDTIMIVVTFTPFYRLWQDDHWKNKMPLHLWKQNQVTISHLYPDPVVYWLTWSFIPALECNFNISSSISPDLVQLKCCWLHYNNLLWSLYSVTTFIPYKCIWTSICNKNFNLLTSNSLYINTHLFLTFYSIILVVVIVIFILATISWIV